jgi:hypothetical protein
MKMRTIGYHLYLKNGICLKCNQIVNMDNMYCYMNVVSETQINFPTFSSIANNIFSYFKKNKYKKI